MRVALALVVVVVVVAMGCKSKSTSSEKPEAPDEPAQPPKEASSAPSDAGAVAERWDGTDPFETPVVKATASGFQVVLERRAGVQAPTGPVPYTAEPYVLWAQPNTSQVVEADVLGTKLELDVNGDGDRKDLLPVACKDGAVVVADTELEPVTDRPGGPMRYVADGKTRIVRIGGKGAHAMVYSPCEGGSASVGVAAAERGFEVLSVPGPALQIMVFEPHGSAKMPTALPMGFEVDGQVVSPPTHVSLNSEPVFGKDVVWTAMYWAMVPVSATAERQVVEVEVPDPKGKRTITARVNLSDEPGVRTPMSPGLLQLGK